MTRINKDCQVTMGPERRDGGLYRIGKHEILTCRHVRLTEMVELHELKMQPCGLLHAPMHPSAY